MGRVGRELEIYEFFFTSLSQKFIMIDKKLPNLLCQTLNGLSWTELQTPT